MKRQLNTVISMGGIILIVIDLQNAESDNASAFANEDRTEDETVGMEKYVCDMSRIILD